MYGKCSPSSDLKPFNQHLKYYSHSQSEIESKVATFRSMLLQQLSSVNNNSDVASGNGTNSHDNKNIDSGQDEKQHKRR